VLCIAMESHPINEKVLLKLFLCKGLQLWKEISAGWRVLDGTRLHGLLRCQPEGAKTLKQ